MIALVRCRWPEFIDSTSSASVIFNNDKEKILRPAEKNILDYNMQIVELENVLETDPRRSNQQLIVRSTVFKAKETVQLFELTDGKRIKKSSLGEVKSLNSFYPDFKVYCLPEQVEETKAKLIAAVDKHTVKMLAMFQHLKSQLDNGSVTMSAKEYDAYIFKSESSPRP
jgi:hypothetical protein